MGGGIFVYLFYSIFVFVFLVLSKNGINKKRGSVIQIILWMLTILSQNYGCIQNLKLMTKLTCYVLPMSHSDGSLLEPCKEALQAIIFHACCSICQLKDQRAENSDWIYYLCVICVKACGSYHTHNYTFLLLLLLLLSLFLSLSPSLILLIRKERLEQLFKKSKKTERNNNIITII